MKRYNGPLLGATYKVVYGYLFYQLLRVKYGKAAHFFLIRGKTGDIFLYFRFLEAYIKQNQIRKYLLVGDGKGLNAIKKLYPNIMCDCIVTNEYTGEALQNIYCLLGAEKLNMTLSLMWDVKLPYNRCAVRLTDSFNFIDSYYWFLFNLDRETVQPTKAVFKKLDRTLEKKLNKEGYVKGKTVILSPYAYCVRRLPPIFWILLGKELEKRRYKVFVMLDESERNEYEFEKVFFTYYESGAVLEYAGNFIGLRSGFCDIISEIKCNKIILYPVKNKRFNGTVHRSDAEYSSFRNMELSENAAEITVPFARDINNFEAETENFTMRISENRKLIRDILRNFPMIEK